MNQEVLIGGGFSVVVAIALLKFVMDLVKSQQKIITNHINHSAQTMVDLKNAIQQLTEVLRERE